MTHTRVPSPKLLDLYQQADTLSALIHLERNAHARARLIFKRMEAGTRIIALQKKEDRQHERKQPTMNLQTIQKKFECDAADAKTIANLFKQADQAGRSAAFGPPAALEKHAEFEDEAGLDLATLETALLLDEGALLEAFRLAYKKAYPS